MFYAVSWVIFLYGERDRDMLVYCRRDAVLVVDRYIKMCMQGVGNDTCDGLQ